jgi:hypothetical protein
MAECPKCSNEIGAAPYCGCGWTRKVIGKDKEKEADEPRVKCAHDSCFMSSTVKIQTRTGWANLCGRHYDEHFVKQAREYCAENGIHTLSQMKRFLKDKVIIRSVPMREPGEDLEEAEA